MTNLRQEIRKDIREIDSELKKIGKPKSSLEAERVKLLEEFRKDLLGYLHMATTKGGL